MKKTMLTLIALLLMSVRFAGAQNYEVVYRMNFDIDASSQLFASLQNVKGVNVETLIQDMNESEIYAMTNTSYDRHRYENLSEKSKFFIHIGDSIVDARNMVGMFRPTMYLDYGKKECYVEMNVIDTLLILKYDMSLIESEVFTQAEGTKNILGHECKKMTSNTGWSLWYAVDIPFKTKVYENVPGLVLETELKGFGKTTAVSITPNDKEIKMPEGPCKEFSAEEVKLMHDQGLKLLK